MIKLARMACLEIFVGALPQYGSAVEEKNEGYNVCNGIPRMAQVYVGNANGLEPYHAGCTALGWGEFLGDPQGGRSLITPNTIGRPRRTGASRKRARISKEEIIRDVRRIGNSARLHLACGLAIIPKRLWCTETPSTI
jgi:hypothetical protein